MILFVAYFAVASFNCLSRNLLNCAYTYKYILFGINLFLQLMLVFKKRGSFYNVLGNFVLVFNNVHCRHVNLDFNNNMSYEGIKTHHTGLQSIILIVIEV